jgi:DNA repair protein RecN (Recombination protein N)
MLLHLRIQNLATIEDLEIDFFDGFSIMTGETGAGKSIMIDGIQLLLGYRADFGLIRQGSSQALVEGIFDISKQPELNQLLSESEIPHENELLIRRVLKTNNRQKRLLNDTSVTQGLLAEVGRRLVHIHGQHDNQALLDASRHLDFLDAFGNLFPKRETLREIHQKWTRKRREQEEWQERLANRTDRQMLLEAQFQELSSLNLEPQEMDDLESESKMLAHAEQLLNLYGEMQTVLYEEDGSVVEVLSSLKRQLQDAERIDPGCTTLLENLDQSLLQLDELSQSLRYRQDRIEDNPERLAWVNDRLSLLQTMQRKYQVTSTAQLIELCERHKKELQGLQNLEEDASALENETHELFTTLREQSTNLSSERKKVAKKLDEAISEELRELGMNRVKFETSFENKYDDSFSSNGSDRAEFMLSVNAGQPLRPLVKIASGGELSRVMLAIQTILTTDAVETLIFDEVDTGISGGIAETVGRKLSDLGKRQQTLCITHLPQIASFAEHHYAVTKLTEKDQTYTSIADLDKQQAVIEIARLLDGSEITNQALKLAREMRKRSHSMTAN